MGILARLRSLFSSGRDPEAPVRLPSPDALVLLAQPQGEPEALMLQDILAQHGIHALVKNRDAVAARGATAGGWWAYELWVLRRDLRRARDLIEGPPDADQALD